MIREGGNREQQVPKTSQRSPNSTLTSSVEPRSWNVSGIHQLLMLKRWSLKHAKHTSRSPSSSRFSSSPVGVMSGNLGVIVWEFCLISTLVRCNSPIYNWYASLSYQYKSVLPLEVLFLDPIPYHREPSCYVILCRELLQSDLTWCIIGVQYISGSLTFWNLFTYIYLFSGGFIWQPG